MGEIPKLDRKGLREFGLLNGTIIAVLFGLILPLIFKHHLSIIPLIVAGCFWILAIFTPKSLEPIYYIWMKIGLALGWVNSRIILGIIFFVIVTPMSLIMRLINRDQMARKFEFQLTTYRLPSQRKTRISMEKPY